jgi:hypothetical protein
MAASQRRLAVAVMDRSIPSLMQVRESTVTAISKTFPKGASAELSDVDMFKTVALFCGIGLLVSLLLNSGVVGLPLGLTPDVMNWM